MPDPIVSLQARLWDLPLNAPFRIATRTAYVASNVLVSVSVGALTGFGAAAPVSYVTGETRESVLEAVAAATNNLIGLDADRIGPLLDKASESLAASPSARAGVEMALLDLWARRHRINLWHYFGARRDHVVTDLTIPIVSAEEARALTLDAVSKGFAHFKVKVGDPNGLEADLARIRSVASAAPKAGIRIDANQAFTPDNAIRFVAKLTESSPNIELLEQPVAKEDIAGLKYVRENISIPVFADEAARDPSSVRRLIREDAVDGINIKLMKSGITGALEIISLCQAAGIKLMIGCMLESRLSLTAAAYIAAGTGAIPVIDLDAHCLLAPDPARTGGFQEDGPRLVVDANGFGWGVEGL
ncbi:MAG: dipeptide epimerase [Capsulimonadaceae bacterium]|nr:dipeptide epimerase [Capsulimonadaceae bacterium]